MPAVPTPRESVVPAPRLPSLTALRAPAALLVVGYHLSLRTPWLEGGPLVDTGFVGVALFFALSGFVLQWSTRPADPATGFWVRRLARIYPAHVLTALIALVVPVTIFSPTALSIAANLTLTQSLFPLYDVVYGLNGVSWSLSCELVFYVVAPFLFAWAHSRSTRSAVLALGGWWAVMAAAGIVLGSASGLTDSLAYPNPVIRSGEFVLGALAALLLRRGWEPPAAVRPLPMTGLVVLVYAVLAVTGLPHTTASVVLAPCCVLLVVALARADARGEIRWTRARPLQWAGEVSFALYLVHELVILNLVPLVPPLASGAGAAGLGWCLAAVCLSFGAAAVLHHLWEKPCQRVILRAWGRWAGASARRVTA